MSVEVEATYEKGILKLDQPLPFQENERVIVSVRLKISRARQSAGLLQWTGDLEELDNLLGPDNQPWAEQ